MTAFTAEQLANTKMLAFLVDQYPLPPANNNPAFRVKFAVIVAALTECSLKDITYGDIGSSSLGFMQQTAGYGSAGGRLNPVTSVDMFLNGGPQGQPAFLKTPWTRGDYPSICRAVQAVQGSQFDGKTLTDGKTINKATGKPYPAGTPLPYADNYINNIADALDALAQAGILPVPPPPPVNPVITQLVPIIAQLTTVDQLLTAAVTALQAIK